MVDISSRTKSLRLNEPPLAGRVQYLPEADSTVVHSIDSGVLFLMAFWSGTSIAALAHLRNALSHCDAAGRLDVVIADVDGFAIATSAKLPELAGRIAGHGEVAWIREGRILYTTNGQGAPEAFETFTLAFLEGSAAGPHLGDVVEMRITSIAGYALWGRTSTGWCGVVHCAEWLEMDPRVGDRVQVKVMRLAEATTKDLPLEATFGGKITIDFVGSIRLAGTSVVW